MQSPTIRDVYPTDVISDDAVFERLTIVPNGVELWFSAQQTPPT
jgi:hypothetical protein